MPQQQYNSIEQIQLVLRVKKQSTSGLFKNQRLLAIKSGYISYYSRVPKQFVGNTRSLQLIGQFPKYTLSAQYVTKIVYKYPILEIEFQKDKLINKNKFKSIVDETENQLNKQIIKLSENNGLWKFKSKQIDISNAFVIQVQTCMKNQKQIVNFNQNKTNHITSYNLPYRRSLQPSLKMVSKGFQVAQEERQSKQLSQIINERASQYFTSQQIQHDLKKRVSDLNLVFKKNNQFMENKGTKKRVVKDAQLVREIKQIQVPQPFVDKFDEVTTCEKINKQEKIQVFPQDRRQNEIKDIDSVELCIQQQIPDLNDQHKTNHQNNIIQQETQKYEHPQLEISDNNINSQPLFETTQQLTNPIIEVQKHKTEQIFDIRQSLDQQQNVETFQQKNYNIEIIDNKQVRQEIFGIVDKNECYKIQCKVEIADNQQRELQRGQPLDNQLNYQAQREITILQIDQQTIQDSKQLCEAQNFTNQCQNNQNQYFNSNGSKDCLDKEVTNTSKRQQYNFVKKQGKQQNNLYSQSSQSLLKLQLVQQFVVNIQSLGYRRREDINKVEDLNQKMKKSSKFESVKEIHIHYNNLFEEQEKKKQKKKLMKQNYSQRRRFNKKQQSRFIMYTDFINYPSLLTPQNNSNHQQQQQQTNNQFSLDSGNLAFGNNEYKSRLYNKFQLCTNLTKLKNSDQFSVNNNIYYMRYKNYQALIGPTDNMIQIDVLFDGNSRVSVGEMRIKSKTDYRQQYNYDDKFQSLLCHALRPNNIFKSYPSIEMIRKLCVEQLCLYLKYNSLVGNSFVDFNQNHHSHIENISQSILRKIQHLNLQQSHSSTKENTSQITHKVIQVFLSEFMGLQIITQQENQLTSKFTVRIAHINNNNTNDQKCISIDKYYIKQLSSESIIILEQNGMYQIQHQISVNEMSLKHKLKYHTNNDCKQFLFTRQEEKDMFNQLKNDTDYYFQTYRTIIKSYSNSSYITKIVSCKDQGLLNLFEQKDNRQFTTFNDQNIKLIDSLCSYIQNINDECSRFEEYFGTKMNPKQPNSSSMLTLKELNTYLSQHSIILSLLMLKLQTITLFYSKIKRKQSNNSDDRLTEQIFLVKLNNIINSFTKQLKVSIQQLRKIISLKMILQKLTQERQIISNLESKLNYLCSVVTNFCSISTTLTLLPQLKPLSKVSQQQQQKVVINQHKLVVSEGLRLVNTLQQLTNTIINPISNNNPPISHRHKHRLQITNFTYNPQHMTIKQVMSLLIRTIDKQDNIYFFQCLQLLIRLWKLSNITDSFLIQTFAAISETYVFHHPKYRQKVRFFLDNQIKTQDKINFINKHPILQLYYRQS